MTFDKSGAFFSKSVKQRIVATSSTHSETIALFSLIKDLVFIINLCEELSFKINTPTLIFEDNKPLIDLTMKGSSGLKKSKHFMMMIAYIREKLKDEVIKLCKINTSENPADILTKSITGIEFQKKRDKLLGNTPEL